MKFSFNSKTLKSIIKLLLLFVLISIIIFYSKTLNVQALTTNNFDKSSSYLHIYLREKGETKTFEAITYFEQPVNFSSFDTKYRQLHLFALDIPFPDYENFEEFSSVGSSVHFYFTLHFKYFYDITNTSYFNAIHLHENPNYYLENANIYENKIYTSISDDGKISYDQFITFEFSHLYIGYISSNWSNTFHIYTYLDFIEVPNLALSVDLVNAMFTSEDALPLSIEEYISNSYEQFFSPEELPYEDSEDEDNTIFGYIKRIFNRIVGVFKTILNIPRLIENAIIDGLSYLFVPNIETFKDTWNDNFELFQEQLGFLFLPFEIIEDFLRMYLDLEESSGVVHIPNVKDPIYGQVLITSRDYNLKQIFSTGAIGTVHNYYLLFVDVLITIGLVNLSWIKFNEIFKGGDDNQ